MSVDEFEDRIMRPLLILACVWEAVALVTGGPPTITASVKWLYRRPVGRVVLWLCFGWLTAHFFRGAAEGMEACDGRVEGTQMA